MDSFGLEPHVWAEHELILVILADTAQVLCELLGDDGRGDGRYLVEYVGCDAVANK